MNEPSSTHRVAAVVRRGDPAWAKEYEAILRAYEQAGGSANVLGYGDVASLVISGNRVLGANEVPGLQIEAEPLPDGVQVQLTVAPHAVFKHPMHLCFGMLPAEGVQRIVADYDIGAGSQVEILAHCTFPNALDLKHIMDARVHIGAGASLTYTEAHFHGPHGGIEVMPKAQIVVDEGGRFSSSFSLVHGRVGKLDIDYVADVAAQGVTDLTTKAYGSGQDEITVRETVRLNGEGARGMAKTRIAVREQAHSHVFTTAEGDAPQARGHMDCTEIVRDQATAENIPQVVVRNDQAQVTHEAAIGTVNRKELETLLARGLDEDAAVDAIIRGMLAG